MSLPVKPLPFFFRHIEPLDRYLLTNQAGAFSFLDEREKLERLIGGDGSQLTEDQLENLYANSFIAEDADHSNRHYLLASRFASLVKQAVTPPSLFMVVPTLRCDHDCSYCQVSRVSATRSGYDLAGDSIEKIIGIIDTISTLRPKIEFQGGEPLMAFPFIRRFVEIAEKKLGPKSPSFVICSALGALSDDVIKWAKLHKIEWSVSLDGPESLHDQNRPSSLFRPYNRVIENIRRISDSVGPDQVSCLATVTRQSLHQATRIVDEYYDLGLNGVFLRPLSPFGFASHNLAQIGYSASEFFEFYKEALDHVIKLNQTRFFVEETTLIHLQKIFRPGSSSFVDLKSPAGHLFGALLFNYDGNVFGSDEARMLWETTKAPELVLGSVDDESEAIFNNSYVASMLSDTFLSTMPGCDECAFQPYCGADPLHHLATQGDHVGDKALSFFCQLERLTFDHIFMLYETSSQAKRTFDRWLTS